MALYRKYRPATFAEVVGQEHVTEPLSVALDAGRINHAYLFSGPRGCGKTSSARILARSLNCEQGPTSTPCGACNSCIALAPGGPGNLDVTEMDAASHGGVEDARELRDRAFYAPAESRYRVFIVDEAHMVTPQGFNALLKIVEEPPEHLIFIFATTEPEKVLTTIRSRTHHYPFRLLAPSVMRPLLERICAAENVAVEPTVYPLVIRAGGGSPRDSLSILDQLLAGAGAEGVTYPRALGLLGVTDTALIDSAVDALAEADGAGLFGAVEKVMAAGHDPRRFTQDLLERFRDLILLNMVPDAGERGLVDVPDDVLEHMCAESGRIGLATLTRSAEVTHASLNEMRGATSPRLLLEVMCARLLLPSADDSQAALLQRIDTLERRPASAAPAAAGPGEPAPANAAPANAAPDVAAPIEGTQSAQPGVPPASPATGPRQPGPATAGDTAQRFVRPSQQPVAAQPDVPTLPQQSAPQTSGDRALPPPAAPVAPAPAPPAAPAPAPPATSVVPATEPPTRPEAEPVLHRPAEPASPAQEPAPAPRPAEPARAPDPEPLASAAPDPEPAAPEPPAPRPAEPAPEPVLTVEQIRTEWPKVLRAVSSRSKVTFTLMANMQVAGLAGDTLHLALPIPALLGRFAEAQHMGALEESVREVFNAAWTVHVGDGSAAPAGQPGSGAPAGAAPSAPAQRADPPKKPHTFQRPSRVAQQSPSPRPAATQRGGGDPYGDDIPLPPEPEPEPAEEISEEQMMADAAAEDAIVGSSAAERRDPDEVALELLKSELGARPI